MNKIFFKSMVSAALSAMLIFSCLTFPAAADEAAVKDEVKTELDATASYVLKGLRDKTASEAPTFDYNDIKNYTLVLKAGLSDKKVTERLSDYIKSLFNADGTNNIEGDFYPSTWYSYIVTLLNELGEDSSNFNGINFNSLLEEYYLKDDSETNLYIQQYIIAAVNADKTAFKNPDKIIEKAENSILSEYISDDSGTGIDYWGVSVDNNGQCLAVLKRLSENNSEIKNKIQASLDWSLAQLNDNNQVVFYGAPSPNSTAMAVKLFAEAGELENAAKAYSGLLTFKSIATEGAYTYGGTDNDYATVDALTALLSYYRALDKKGTLDVVKSEAAPSDGETASGDDSSSSDETSSDMEETDSGEVSAPPTGDSPHVILFTAALAVSAAVYGLFSKKHNI